MSFDLPLLFAWYLVFLFSVSLHEASHAWVAKIGGDKTAYHGGQVSIDPIPHIRREPLGMVLFPLIALFTIGYPLGFASAPYDAAWAERHPKRAAWMSLAGPGANLMLCLVAGGIIRTGFILHFFSAPEHLDYSHITTSMRESWFPTFAIILSLIFSQNLILALFNLIPLPPLDGMGALGLILPPSLARSFRTIKNHPMMAMMGLLVAWKVFPLLFKPVFWFTIELLYPGVQYK